MNIFRFGLNDQIMIDPVRSNIEEWFELVECDRCKALVRIQFITHHINFHNKYGER